MLCVVKNQKTGFCWPFPGGDTGRRSQSVKQGSNQRGRMGVGVLQYGFCDTSGGEFE